MSNLAMCSACWHAPCACKPSPDEVIADLRQQLATVEAARDGLLRDLRTTTDTLLTRAEQAEAERDRAVKDAERLDWLDANEADLVFHREIENEAGEYSIWCNVVKDGKSISGHPLAYARDSIDAAIAAGGEGTAS